MKGKKIAAGICLFFGIGMLLSGFSLLTNPPADATDMDPTMTGYIYLGIGAIVAIISIFILIKNRTKKEPRSFSKETNDSTDKNTNFKLKNKPAPYKLWAFIALILSFGSAIGISIAFPNPKTLFDIIGDLAWNGAIALAIIFLAFAIYSIKQINYYASSDSNLSLAFHAATKKKVTLFSTMKFGFKNYFPGIYGDGPLVYTNNENRVAKKRIVYYTISMIIKFVFPYIALLALTGYCISFFTSGGSMYTEFQIQDFYRAIGLFLLIFGPSIDVLLYIIRRILPTYKVDEYEITTYYKSGKVTKEKEFRSNIIAVLFMGALTFVYTCGFFWYFCPRQLGRIVETKRFLSYGNTQSDEITIFDYYQHN